jgi:hypothetical protein
VAFGVGAAIGLIVFYFARILLSRDPLEAPPERDRLLEPGSGEGEVG